MSSSTGTCLVSSSQHGHSLAFCTSAGQQQRWWYKGLPWAVCLQIRKSFSSSRSVGIWRHLHVSRLEAVFNTAHVTEGWWRVRGREDLSHVWSPLINQKQALYAGLPQQFLPDLRFLSVDSACGRWQQNISWFGLLVMWLLCHLVLHLVVFVLFCFSFKQSTPDILLALPCPVYFNYSLS